MSDGVCDVKQAAAAVYDRFEVGDYKDAHSRLNELQKTRSSDEAVKFNRSICDFLHSTDGGRVVDNDARVCKFIGAMSSLFGSLEQSGGSGNRAALCVVNIGALLLQRRQYGLALDVLSTVVHDSPHLTGAQSSERASADAVLSAVHCLFFLWPELAPAAFDWLEKHVGVSQRLNKSPATVHQTQDATRRRRRYQVLKTAAIALSESDFNSAPLGSVGGKDVDSCLFKTWIYYASGNVQELIKTVESLQDDCRHKHALLGLASFQQRQFMFASMYFRKALKGLSRQTTQTKKKMTSCQRRSHEASHICYNFCTSFLLHGEPGPLLKLVPNHAWSLGNRPSYWLRLAEASLLEYQTAMARSSIGYTHGTLLSCLGSGAHRKMVLRPTEADSQRYNRTFARQLPLARHRSVDNGDKVTPGSSPRLAPKRSRARQASESNSNASNTEPTEEEDQFDPTRCRELLSNAIAYLRVCLCRLNDVQAKLEESGVQTSLAFAVRLKEMRVHAQLQLAYASLCADDPVTTAALCRQVISEYKNEANVKRYAMHLYHARTYLIEALTLLNDVASAVGESEALEGDDETLQSRLQQTVGPEICPSIPPGAVTPHDDVCCRLIEPSHLHWVFTYNKAVLAACRQDHIHLKKAIGLMSEIPVDRWRDRRYEHMVVALAVYLCRATNNTPTAVRLLSRVYPGVVDASQQTTDGDTSNGSATELVDNNN